MAPQTFAVNWGTTKAEQQMLFPCDSFLPAVDQVYFRAVTVHTPASVLFRWLCQLRVAPYSYDWIDNWGIQSPRRLIPGLEKLEIGQRVMSIFQLVGFEQDRYLTLLLTSIPARSLFGKIALTYMIVPQNELRCRLIVKLRVQYPHKGIWSLMRAFLPWGDWFMMRKQLLTLKQLAEQQGVSGQNDQR